MENSQKALQMAAAAFLFVLAASMTIFLYSKLMENTKKILVISDMNTYSSEYAVLEDGNYERDITRDEIVMTILEMENNKSYISKIIVPKSKTTTGTYSFTKVNKTNLKNFITNNNSNSTFRLSYNDANKTLTYIYK